MSAAKKIKTPIAKPIPNEYESATMASYDPYKQSDLFHSVYLNVEVPHKFKNMWDIGEEGDFGQFCNTFRNLCSNYTTKDFESWSEMDTIQKWIIPVLESLGYYDKCKNKEQPFSLDTSFTLDKKSLRPDFIIVDRPADLLLIKNSKNTPEQKLDEARSYVKLTVEAKYWDRLSEYGNSKIEDKSKDDNKKNNESKDPVEQTLEYMKMLNNDWGILTDGKVWRLYHQELSSDSQKRCFQFNLGYLAKYAKNNIDTNSEEYKSFIENAKYFYFLFNKNALFGIEGKGKILNDLIEYSKEYVHRIEDDMRKRFVQAMTTFCNGLHESIGKPTSEEKLDLIRNVAESHLFNVMFIKSCESRLVLPMKSDYMGRSLTRMVQCLKWFKPDRGYDDHNFECLQKAFGNANDENSFQFKWDGTELYERLLNLTEFVQKGTNSKFPNFKIEGFTETVFSEEEWSVAQKYKVKNKYMVSALFEIGYAKPDPKLNKYQQIPYNFFTARQLGSIYESFLEFKIDIADADLAFVKKQWIPAKITSDLIIGMDVPTAAKNTLFFTPNNEKRKATGTYYTPDCVVQYIVEETISPLVKNKSYKEIAKIKVCDPAMGSGHFINASLNFLAKKYFEAFEKENYLDEAITLQDAKREILHNCIYGVDINPRATKLTKMGLWLESAKAGSKLEILEDQIKCANSLTEFQLWKNEWKFLDKGIDAVVGNPPYLGEKSHKEIFQPVAAEWLGKRFYQGKMDLFYFFFHLGLDILKENGRLGFITTNYFTTALGAKNLRLDFYERTNIDLLINLNELKVFGEAAGQHNMITVLSKSDIGIETRIINSKENGKCTESVLKEVVGGLNKKTSYNLVKKPDLFDGEEKYLRIGSSLNGTSKNTSQFASVIAKIKSSDYLLGEIFDVNTGIQTGADKVSPAHISKFKVKAEKGDGIFVLSKEEVNSLGLNKQDLETLIKPFFKNSDVSKFSTVNKTNEKLIYTNRDCGNISSNVKTHLSKFKNVLSERREVKNNVINWFQLQWPREKSIFTGAKIIAPQRSKLNTFGYNEVDWYASADVYFITSKSNSQLDLKSALGLLNSKLYFFWLYSMGKRKGEALELYQKPLSEIPIKKIAKEDQKKITKLVDTLTHSHDEHSWNKLNSLVYEIYGLSKQEIEAVDSLYDDKQSKNKLEDSDESFNEDVAS